MRSWRAMKRSPVVFHDTKEAADKNVEVLRNKFYPPKAKQQGDK